MDKACEKGQVKRASDDSTSTISPLLNAHATRVVVDCVHRLHIGWLPGQRVVLSRLERGKHKSVSCWKIIFVTTYIQYAKRPLNR